MTKTELHVLKAVRDAATLERASFSRFSTDEPLPTSEAEVTDFIRKRTQLYRETWIIPKLDALIAKYEGKFKP